MATLITAIIGWFLVSFLHIHYLGRDEVARKKESVQDELQSLSDWALDSKLILSNSAELNEEYLSSKIALLELRLKELYKYYFRVDFPHDFDAFYVNVETVDEDNIDAFQVSMISVIYNWKIGVEAEYDVYFKSESFYKRLKMNAVKIMKYSLFWVFVSSTILSFIIFSFIG